MTKKSGFNPCFSGTRARTRGVDSSERGYSQFQSLFFWNSRPDGVDVVLVARDDLVSILVFLELAPGLEKRLLDIRQKVMFQSLFFWNSRPDHSKILLLLIRDWFQSLFFWNSRPDISWRHEESTSPAVSILVFLELAPGLHHFCHFAPSSVRFNPCFSGTRARTFSRPFQHRDKHGFNPCFSGTRARTWDGHNNITGDL